MNVQVERSDEILALSTSIRSLERELGCSLSVRTTRTVEMTDTGRALPGEARQTLAAAASARESVLAVQGMLRPDPVSHLTGVPGTACGWAIAGLAPSGTISPGES